MSSPCDSEIVVDAEILTVESVQDDASISVESSIEQTVLVCDDGCEEVIATLEETTVVVTDTSVTDSIDVVVSETLTVEVCEQGPPGVDGVSAGPAYTHTQVSAQSSWTVFHNLSRKPLVDVRTNDEQIISRITFPNGASALVEFNSPQTGVALCF